MPGELNSKTNKVHCNFNQYGAVTGRFSSSNPNMQNIPSHNNDIRKMFLADEGYYMLGCDYSAQEPRLTSRLLKLFSAVATQRSESVACETFGVHTAQNGFFS